MEVTAGTIYLISLATNIKLFLLVCALAVVLLSPFIINAVESKLGLRCGHGVIPIAIVVLVLLFLMCIIPGSKTLIAMYVIPEILSVQGIEDLPANVVGFLNDYLNPADK